MVQSFEIKFDKLDSREIGPIWIWRNATVSKLKFF